MSIFLREIFIFPNLIAESWKLIAEMIPKFPKIIIHLRIHEKIILMATQTTPPPTNTQEYTHEEGEVEMKRKN